MPTSYGQLTLTLCVCLLLSACNSSNTKSDNLQGHEFDLRSLAKSDINSIVELHVRSVRDNLQTLMVKLYKRNPRELEKSPGANLHQRINTIFARPPKWGFAELQGKVGSECISLAFSDSYQGDRVLAYIVGLNSMLMSAYDNKTEFYMFDSLQPQKLYNSARNIEIAVWKLSNNRDPNGELYLLSNSLPDEVTNLSFERLFGKMISLQDTLAMIVSDGTNRVIKTVIQKMATAVFLPV